MISRPSSGTSSHPLRARAAFGLATVALLGLAACGGGGESDSGATIPADADLVVTAVPSIRWDKASYTAPAGEITVVLENKDSIRHDLVILDGDQKVPGLELIAKTQGAIETGTVTLEPGTYSIFCVVPGHQGMKSELVVS